MKPKPFSALNHLTVPVAILLILCVRATHLSDRSARTEYRSGVLGGCASADARDARQGLPGESGESQRPHCLTRIDARSAGLRLRGWSGRTDEESFRRACAAVSNGLRVLMDMSTGVDPRRTRQPVPVRVVRGGPPC